MPKKIFRYKAVKILLIFFLLAAVVTVVVRADRSIVRSAEEQAYDIETLTDKRIADAINEKDKKLMIVAHPDDDVIWGGGHLMSGDYLVVCVTNGRNKTRSKEFADVITASGNDFIMLDYPDKVANRRDLWTAVMGKISKDLEAVIKYKDWEQIVVHNQAGEYGHIHHQNVHSIVTEIYDRDNIKSPLYCFGKYYKAVDIDSVKDDLTPISDEEYEFKKNLADMYKSQKKTVKKLWHMARYEMWTEYERYSEHPLYRDTTEKRQIERGYNL